MGEKVNWWSHLDVGNVLFLTKRGFGLTGCSDGSLGLMCSSRCESPDRSGTDITERGRKTYTVQNTPGCCTAKVVMWGVSEDLSERLAEGKNASCLVDLRILSPLTTLSPASLHFPLSRCHCFSKPPDSTTQHADCPDISEHAVSQHRTCRTTAPIPV